MKRINFMNDPILVNVFMWLGKMKQPAPLLSR